MATLSMMALRTKCMQSVIMLIVTFFERRKEDHYAECYYVERRYADCRGAKQAPLSLTTCFLGPML